GQCGAAGKPQLPRRRWPTHKARQSFSSSAGRWDRSRIPRWSMRTEFDRFLVMGLGSKTLGIDLFYNISYHYSTLMRDSEAPPYGLAEYDPALSRAHAAACSAAGNSGTRVAARARVREAIRRGCRNQARHGSAMREQAPSRAARLQDYIFSLCQ